MYGGLRDRQSLDRRKTCVSSCLQSPRPTILMLLRSYSNCQMESDLKDASSKLTHCRPEHCDLSNYTSYWEGNQATKLLEKSRIIPLYRHVRKMRICDCRIFGTLSHFSHILAKCAYHIFFRIFWHFRWQ